jgi:hypothetical protein
LDENIVITQYEQEEDYITTQQGEDVDFYEEAQIPVIYLDGDYIDGYFNIEGLEDLEQLFMEFLEQLLQHPDYPIEIVPPAIYIPALPDFAAHREAHTRVITNLEELYYFGGRAIIERHFQTEILGEQRFIITRTLTLPIDAPEIIRLDGFVLSDGMVFEFYNLRRLEGYGVLRHYYTINVELETPTSDIQYINSRLRPFIAGFTNSEGHQGNLFLNEESIATIPLNAEFERVYLERTVIYENVAFGDISRLAISFIEDGIGFRAINVEWQPLYTQGTANLSYDELLYNVIVTYQGWYSYMTIPAFRTIAVYSGYLYDFEHFPSAMYEVSFMSVSMLADEREELYGYGQIPAPAPPSAQGINIVPLIITVVIILVLGAGIAFAFKKGLFDKLLKRFRQKGDDEEDFEEDDEN